MKTAYICSPYKGETEMNVEYAKELTKEAIKRGYAPVTPHLYLTQCLDDNKTKERELWLDIALSLVEKCDTILIGTKYTISEGMRKEIQIAYELQKLFEYHY